MASSFSANWGSLLSLKVRDKWGFRPFLCQIRRTLFSLRPVATAIVRVLQWVALRGFSRVVFRITAWILAGGIVVGLSRRWASLSHGAQPTSRKRIPPAA